jgi:hypothetical protein|tara:strand:- start:1345 stop:1473 length:129 start_codon:yes stop_codon:yes gene_type:complete
MISCEKHPLILNKSDKLHIKYPVLVIIGCPDIFSDENIGKSK